MLGKTGRWRLLGVLILTIAASGRAEVTDEQVRQAIQRGVAFLGSQQRPDGSWPENAAYPGGITSLVALALLNAGVEAQDPGLQRAVSYLRGLDPPNMVYATSLQTMVFCAAEPEKDAPLIRRNVDWLQSVQLTSGDRKGAWSYSAGRGNGDNSNTQFAVLALYEAERVGVPSRPEVWQNGWDYWLRTQEGDGSWGYFQGEPSTGSMTCAGIASLIMCAGTLHPGDAKVVDGAVQCCGEQTDDAALNRALQWLGAKFSSARNPSPLNLGSPYYYYYLYGVERVGRLSGRRFLGQHDWYREGAEMLVSQQDGLRGLWRGSGNAENNPLIATSFALLFLSKGRRPVVVAKLKYGDGAEWDLHRSAVGNLTRRVEKRWRRDLTWQTIDVSVATAEDLAQAPVLFLSGRRRLQLTRRAERELARLRQPGRFSVRGSLLRRRRVRPRRPGAAPGAVSGQPSAPAPAGAPRVVGGRARESRPHAAPVRDRGLLPHERRVLPPGSVLLLGTQSRQAAHRLPRRSSRRSGGVFADRRERADVRHEPRAEKQARSPPVRAQRRNDPSAGDAVSCVFPSCCTAAGGTTHRTPCPICWRSWAAKACSA